MEGKGSQSLSLPIDSRFLSIIFTFGSILNFYQCSPLSTNALHFLSSSSIPFQSSLLFINAPHFLIIILVASCQSHSLSINAPHFLIIILVASCQSHSLSINAPHFLIIILVASCQSHSLSINAPHFINPHFLLTFCQSFSLSSKPTHFRYQSSSLFVYVPHILLSIFASCQSYSLSINPSHFLSVLIFNKSSSHPINPFHFISIVLLGHVVAYNYKTSG